MMYFKVQLHSLVKNSVIKACLFGHFYVTPCHTV
jgi:hypothetical protein